jgi:hypothetical protein
VATEVATPAFSRNSEGGQFEGELIGREIGIIHLCQSLLNQPITPKEKLLALSLEDLTRLASDLRRQAVKP